MPHKCPEQSEVTVCEQMLPAGCKIDANRQSSAANLGCVNNNHEPCLAKLQQDTAKSKQSSALAGSASSAATVAACARSQLLLTRMLLFQRGAPGKSQASHEFSDVCQAQNQTAAQLETQSAPSVAHALAVCQDIAGFTRKVAKGIPHSEKPPCTTERSIIPVQPAGRLKKLKIKK